MLTLEEYTKRKRANNILVLILLLILTTSIISIIYLYKKLKTKTIDLEKAKIELQNKDAVMAYVMKQSRGGEQKLAKVDSIVKSKNPQKEFNTIIESAKFAEQFAREGYELLKVKNFIGAKNAFDKSEKSYIGYKSSYDIYFLLWKNRDKLNDPDTQKEILEIVYNKYNSFGILNKNDLK